MKFTRVLASLLASGQTVRFTAPGRSMHPEIRHGDTLLVHPLDRPARVGEILLYRDAAGRPVAHRLVGFAAGGEGDTLIFRGDSAAAPDLPVGAGQVLGRVFAIERGGRRIDPYGARSNARRGLHAAAARVTSELLKHWGRIRPAARRVSS
jgi:hypothetical protein